VTTRTESRPDVTTAVAQVIRYLETGVAAEGLFAADVVAHVTFPQWYVRVEGAEDLLALRASRHPWPGRVRVARVEPNDRGFTMEFEERWEGDDQHWYSREMLRADVVGSTIVEIAIYCAGDWDEAVQRRHATGNGLRGG